MPELPKLLAIVGPTGSGKTALGWRLAYKFAGEILCADSRTVYRGMDIGTAKPVGTRATSGAYAGATQKHGVQHWLLDLVDPPAPFTVADWKRAALAVIPKIRERHHLPIVVGGTGLFVQALVENYEPPAVAPNPTLRATLEAKPLAELARMLKGYDPEAAGRIDLKNPRRVIRALEVFILSGQPVSAQRRKGPALFDTLELGIDLPRDELYAHLDRRVNEQVREGLFDEVARLVKKYGKESPAFSAIGYREVIAYFDKRMTKAETIEKIKTDTHSYARRQMTWLRRDKRVRWVKDAGEAEALVREWLRK